MTPEMNQAATPPKLNDALAGLLDKYAVAPSGAWRIVDGGQLPGETGDVLTLMPGWMQAETDLPEQTVPLLPWRHERRFVELKQIVDGETVTPVLTCRFACLTDGREMPLAAILYREFDLLEWISGQPIVAIQASMAEAEKGVGSNLPERPAACFAQIGPKKGSGPICRNGPEGASHKLDPTPFSRPFLAANVIVRLEGGAIGSVEAGTTLPAGTAPQDRHELIARRGVASDRVVDTQVAQSSVYTWTDAGDARHTDVDAELFGLDAEQVSVVRAAYDVLCRGELAAGLRNTHARLRRLVEQAYESDRRRERLTLEAKKGSGPICAKHAAGRSGKLDPTPFSSREGDPV